MKQRRLFPEKDFRRPQDLYGIRRITFEWTIIIVALYLGTKSNYCIPLSLILLGRSQLLLDNIGHYAAHDTLFKTPVLNRLLSFLYFFPVCTTFDEWRAEHDLHHKYLGSDNDPGEQAFRRWGLYNQKIYTCFAAVPLREAKNNLRLLRFWRDNGLRSFWLLILLSVVVFGGWKILALWSISFFTTRQWFIFISEVGEHFKAENNHTNKKWVAGSRIFTKNFLLIKSECDRYHWLHHMFPKVSPNMLSKAYAAYRKNFSVPKQQSVIEVLEQVT